MAEVGADTGPLREGGAGGSPLGAGHVGAVVCAFLGSVALWWVYFDRSAPAAGTVIAVGPAGQCPPLCCRH